MEQKAREEDRGPKRAPLLSPVFWPAFCSSFSALRFHGFPHGYFMFFFTSPFLGQRSPLRYCIIYLKQFLCIMVPE